MSVSQISEQDLHLFSYVSQKLIIKIWRIEIRPFERFPKTFYLRVQKLEKIQSSVHYLKKKKRKWKIFERVVLLESLYCETLLSVMSCRRSVIVGLKGDRLTQIQDLSLWNHSLKSDYLHLSLSHLLPQDCWIELDEVCEKKIPEIYKSKLFSNICMQWTLNYEAKEDTFHLKCT